MGLYPPIVASSMPAFNINEGKVRIYFTLSNYNSSKIEDIKAVHITCRRQSSNVNVIKVDKNTHYTEILLKTWQQDDSDIPFHRYYVELLGSLIINEKNQKSQTTLETLNGFEADVLYKVQLRLSSKIDEKQEGMSFYTNNIENFSLWSTVCIIKPINVPLFYIDDFHVEGEVPKEYDINNFYQNLADFVGIFKKGESSLTLKTWRLRLLSNTYTRKEKTNIDSYTLADSGIQISSAYNYTLDNESVVLECSLPYLLKESTSYKLLFEITTLNDYQNDFLYTFVYSPQNVEALPGTETKKKLKTFVNEEEGYIKISYSSDMPYSGNIVLRRADVKSNFLKWEDLKNFEMHGGDEGKSFDYYDFTVESGMVYRYLVQIRDARGRRGTPLYTESYTVALWEHAFLLLSSAENNINQTKQLKLKFDFQISSYTTNISESKTDTIGSRYPYIRRNGNMYYRSFPCTGLITGYMDSADLFTNENLLYDNHPNYYKQFRGLTDQWQTYVNQYDYTYERKFREKVELFLYNVKPKLYKSTQEGNILIKLMDISLTPKQLLGRLVYTFSATAYEIDLPTISILNSYGILNIGNYNPKVEWPKEQLGQLNSYNVNGNPKGNIFKADCDIIGAGKNGIKAAANSIAAHYNYLKSTGEKNMVGDFSLSYLRLTIESDPYLIVYDGSKFIPLDDTPLESYDSTNDPFDPGDITHKLYQIESSYDYLSVYLGYLFEINGLQIIISPPNNIYEIKEDGLVLGSNTTIVPAKDTFMTIDFVITLLMIEDLSQIPKFIRVEDVNAQLMGTFSSINLLIARIKYQYEYTFADVNEDLVKRQITGVKTILADTEPGTIIKLRTSADDSDTLHRFIVNLTGLLFFEPYMTDNIPKYITKFYICGRNISKNLINNRGEDFTSLEQVLYPIDKDFCKVNDVPYIYFKNKWYKALLQDNDNSYDIDCPVDALLFYYAGVERRFY